MKLFHHRLLHHRADARSVAFVLCVVALLALQWAGWLRNPAVFAATLLGCFIACVVNHNHQHSAVFVPAWGNRFFGVLLAWATGQPAKAIVPMHIGNHHAHNNEPADHVRATLVKQRWNLLNLLVFPFVAVRGYARVKAADLAAWRERNPTFHRQLRVERLAFYPLLALLLLLRPADTLLFLGLPYLAGQWGIIAINLVQHDGCDPASPYDNSRNHVGRVLNWWLFNNGYHTAHHLRPGLHWSRLPAYHGRIRDRIHPRLERRSLVASLVELYLWPGRRPRIEELSA